MKNSKGKKKVSRGYILVFQNTSLPGMYKVVDTISGVVEAFSQVNNARTVESLWQVRDYWFCEEPYSKEQEISRRLEELGVAKSDEGFKVDYMTIRKVAFEVLGIADDSEDDSYW
jgi:hypothetical protein